jgi:hypothetical protein
MSGLNGTGKTGKTKAKKALKFFQSRPINLATAVKWPQAIKRQAKVGSA